MPSVKPLADLENAAPWSNSVVRLGDVVNDKYRIDRILGWGSMALVVEAFHLGLEERVALKFLRPEIARDKSFTTRFEMEAKAASKLKGAHVGRVTDIDRREDGTPFIVMEFLQGTDLEGLLERDGRLQIEEAVGYIIQACEALAEAHARGIVHRDVKPANLFLLEREGELKSIKLLDFGISKAALGGAHLLNAEEIVGSPYYMSPEQLLTPESIDARSDLWALGAVLFELLAGETAFDSSFDQELLFQSILGGAPRKLTDFAPLAPVELEEIIDRCLQRDPNARFENAAALAAALFPFANRRMRGTVEGALKIAHGPTGVPPALDSLPPGSQAFGAGQRPPQSTAMPRTPRVPSMVQEPAAAPTAAGSAPAQERVAAAPSATVPSAPSSAGVAATAASAALPVRRRSGSTIAAVALLGVCLVGGIAYWLVSSAQARAEKQAAEAAHALQLQREEAWQNIAASARAVSAQPAPTALTVRLAEPALVAPTEPAVAAAATASGKLAKPIVNATPAPAKPWVAIAKPTKPAVTSAPVAPVATDPGIRLTR